MLSTQVSHYNLELSIKIYIQKYIIKTIKLWSIIIKSFTVNSQLYKLYSFNCSPICTEITKWVSNQRKIMNILTINLHSIESRSIDCLKIIIIVIGRLNFGNTVYHCEFIVINEFRILKFISKLKSFDSQTS